MPHNEVIGNNSWIGPPSAWRLDLTTGFTASRPFFRVAHLLGPLYAISQSLEKVVGLQTDAPLKRAIKPLGT
jgi:hypothetical protein